MSALRRPARSLTEAPRAVLEAVLVGRAVPFARGASSAIDKRPVRGRIAVRAVGLDGDEQGDRAVHGGLDKAVHYVPLEHHDWFYRELAGDVARARLGTPGAFGENLAGRGLLEADVCLGDRVRVGTAVLEVSQSRQPCWKQSVHLAEPGLARRMQDTLRTGWYFRVLEEGHVGAGDELTLLERPFPDWSLARVGEVLYATDVDVHEHEAFSRLPLVPGWRARVERRLATGRIEDWSSRLDGPPARASAGG